MLPQAEDFGVNGVQHFPKPCACGLALREHLVTVLPVHGRPEGLHGAEKDVDRGILRPVVLIRDEGDGMEVAVSVRATLQLEHLRSLDAACVIARQSG